MGSMNNWLAFSLSPHELPPPQPHPSPSAVSRLISADDCFGLSADSASAPPLGIPTLRPDGSFGILEALHRTSHQPQDWSMKSSVDFKGGSSELSMLVGSSSNRNNMDDEQPKLEDFLGGHSFSDSDQKLYDTGSGYLFNDCSLQLPVVQSENGAAHNNSSIGISMIKSWLRNQPAPQQQLDGIANGSGAAAGGLGTSQSLSLSMSTGSQSSSSLPLLAAGGNGVGECSSSDGKQKASGSGLDAQSGAIDAVPRKSIDTFGQRTSIYRGVTRHRWTGRYEAHLWDNSCRREGQTRKGRQVYLGGYDKEDKAARAYDLAALKYWGPTTTTNFPITNYEKELEEMKHMTRQEYVASLRRKSSGFSRGASIYRGVTRHHQHGRWQARIGRVAGNKDLYLGTFSTQEEAAEAYDIAAIKFRGLNAVTNFEMSRYDVKSILESSTLPIGGAAKRLKESSDQDPRIDGNHNNITTSQLTDGIGAYATHYHPGWPAVAFPQPQAMGIYNTYGHNKGWCKQEQQDAIMAAHSLQDLHHLHLSSSTHNFFQQPSVPQSLMSLDSSSMEHSTGSNSVNYQGFAMHNGGSGGYGGGEGNMMLSSESYATRNNSYFISPQSAVSVAKTSGYEQSSTCTNAWMPASVQAVAARASDVGVCNGAAPLFPVWNDG